MVKLDRIYTRGGDKGETSLGTGERIAKASPRVEAYGEVDELNAHIGNCARLYPRRGERLAAIMNDLFDMGGDLCVPGDPKMAFPESYAERLEAWIDESNSELPPLKSFVLPGGSEAGVALHLARTVARRAERRVCALAATEGERVTPAVVTYLNRLSDLLFVWAREANGPNGGGEGEVLWEPGKNA